jgi:hypothetical protein
VAASTAGARNRSRDQQHFNPECAIKTVAAGLNVERSRPSRGQPVAGTVGGRAVPGPPKHAIQTNEAVLPSQSALHKIALYGVHRFPKPRWLLPELRRNRGESAL